MLSKAAWNALLKPLKSRQVMFTFALCTTDEDKVPDTIKTRCTCLRLKSVPFSDLVDLLVQSLNLNNFQSHKMD